MADRHLTYGRRAPRLGRVSLRCTTIVPTVPTVTSTADIGIGGGPVLRLRKVSMHWTASVN